MAIVSSLVKTQVGKVIGVDASTQSFAYAILDDGLVEYGKVFFNGTDLAHKLYDGKIKINAIMSRFEDVDYGAIEASVMVRSAQVAIKLAYFDGMIMSELMNTTTHGASFVAPSEWQSFIHNVNWTKQRKSELQTEFPGHTTTWYKNEIRKRRKQYTLDHFNKMYGVNIQDDDVADAVGVAYYARMALIR